MNILITGGTGLIGTALIHELKEHKITVLTRSISKAQQQLPDGIRFIEQLDMLANFDEIDAVINLAGEPIIDKRWTKRQKGILCSSRWDLTNKLVDKILASNHPPALFISGSAVGFYGNQGNKEIDENSEISAKDFAHSLCLNWEKIALRAQSKKTRVCLLRTGIVLSLKGGALKKMYPSFWLGLGGSIGAGEQYMPWIHIEDMVQAIKHLIRHEEAQGAFNLSAPQPVTNKAFAAEFAKAIKRPSFFCFPAFVVKATLGEAAHLLLDSQRILPKRLQESGYQFRFATLDAAFKDLFS